MPRIRTIKPEFPLSESMGRVSRHARLLFILLWTIADDHGKLRGNSRMIASVLFPYDDDAPHHTDGWLKELEREGCIIRYRGDGKEGAHYIKILRWREHQRVDKPGKSTFPDPPEGKKPTPENIREDSENVRESSCEDLRTKDQRTRDQGSKDQGPEECCSEGDERPSEPPSKSVGSEDGKPGDTPAKVDPRSLRFPDFPTVPGRKKGAYVWTLTDEVSERLQDAFPAVDVQAEARRAHAWVMAKLARRKTAGGMEGFLFGWMSREQDKGGKRSDSGNQPQRPRVATDEDLANWSPTGAPNA